MTVELFHDQSSQKYGTRPRLNSGPLDLQSDSYLEPGKLPTALRGPVIQQMIKFATNCHLLVATFVVYW